jgi:response regulator of citrate/malate metabolism
MSGPDAASRLRKMGYRGVIIGVTGNAASEEIRYFVKSGANEVLIKPVTYDMLEQCLSRFAVNPEIEEVHPYSDASDQVSIKQLSTSNSVRSFRIVAE